MVNQAIATLGHIDILVNNAGIYQEHPLDTTSYQDWQAAAGNYRHQLDRCGQRVLLRSSTYDGTPEWANH
jgi:hypothetical protein